MGCKEQTLASKQASKQASGNTRNSSIELLKIIGIILIIFHHVGMTLHNPAPKVSDQDYLLNLALATTDIQRLILAMTQYNGAIGNTLFFVCSAWFLLDSRKVNKRKILQMVMDIWVVSIIILIVVYVLRNGQLDLTTIIKQVFPTTFSNNWYMTCYLLFYSVHPFLNMVIYKVEKPTLLKTTLAMLFLYAGVNLIDADRGFFYSSPLIMFVVIYFAMAYMKLYLVDISNNIKLNVRIFLTGFIGNYGLVLLTDFLGLHINIFNYRMLRWAAMCNPFILLMVIGLFNIARNIHFENKAINYISGLSMFIYIIHENELLRTYYRPAMWKYVYANMGYDLVLLWAFALFLIIFLFALVSSIVYRHTIRKLVTRIGDALYPKLCSAYGSIEQFLLKMH